MGILIRLGLRQTGFELMAPKQHRYSGAAIRTPQEQHRQTGSETWPGSRMQYSHPVFGRIDFGPAVRPSSTRLYVAISGIFVSTVEAYRNGDLLRRLSWIPNIVPPRPIKDPVGNRAQAILGDKVNAYDFYGDESAHRSQHAGQNQSSFYGDASANEWNDVGSRWDWTYFTLSQSVRLMFNGRL